MPDKPNPTADAAKSFADVDVWTNFMNAHNQPKRASYVETLAAPNAGTLKSGYGKFLRSIDIPNPYTATVSLDGFSKEEVNAVLHLLDKLKVHSTMAWGKTSDVPEITIRDGNNAHLSSSPIQSLRDQQKRLAFLEPDIILDDEPVVKAKPVQAEEVKPVEALYIPAFNTLHTEKGAYILLDHMHYQDEALLSEALTSRGITFKEYDSSSFGSVFVVRFNMEQYEELGKMMKEARTDSNRDKAPENARIYRPAKGDPAINILDGGGEKHIPIEGMVHTQTEALKARLSKAEIPFTTNMNSSNGPVFVVSEEHEDKLEALRVVLRTEHNARKTATVATPAGPYASKDYV